MNIHGFRRNIIRISLVLEVVEAVYMSFVSNYTAYTAHIAAAIRHSESSN
jgi:hypothetical protein